MRSPTIIVTFFAFMGFAGAQEAAPLHIYSADRVRVFHRKTDLNSETQDSTFEKPKSASSSKRLPQTPPQSSPQVQTQSGVSLVSLIKKYSEKTVNPDTAITVVGDGPQAIQSVYKDFERENSFLTMNSDKAPQLVFPIAQKEGTIYREKSWWLPKANAVVVGTLPPLIQVNGAPINLKTFAQQENFESLVSFPKGKMIDAPKKQKYSVQCVLLRNLPDAADIKSFEYLTLSEKTVSSDQVDEMMLCHSWNQKPIEPWLGGPVQLCSKRSPLKCVYFVKSISFSK